MAMLIDGEVLVGALMLSVSPASLTALAVRGPKAAISVEFCSKLGKFLNKDLIPEGLKKTNMSYLEISRLVKSLAVVRYMMAFVKFNFASRSIRGMSCF